MSLKSRFREIPKHLQQVTSEQAREARNTNLVEYLSGREELVRIDRKGRYRLKQHDSLILRESFYWWNSRGESGNAIDFMQSFYGMDFKTAVIELTNTKISTKKEFASVSNTAQIPQESVNFSLPELNQDMRRTFAYLLKTRCIDTSIVQKFVNEKLILQDERNNIVFPWLDENKKIVGADLNGTLTYKRFKGIVHGSNHDYSYNIQIGSPTKLYAFESPIDLLSYLSLHKSLNNALLISLSGLKIETLKSYLKRHTSLTDVFLCVDNDNAGNNFIKSVQAEINVSTKQPPAPHKDWNDYLKSQRPN